MEDHILQPFSEDKEKLHHIFQKILEGNTILFLGAGASITDEKKYLSSNIIEYYEDKKGKNLGISNITEFLDVLSETHWFDRREFDQYVHDLLVRLKVTDIQRTILSIKWRQIITTNFDMLLEKAESEMKETEKCSYDLLPVRDIKEYFHFYDNNQVQYIKLNGCMSDKGKYPFLFSTQDFKSASNYYKKVLQNLKSVSDRITFLSAGYSYSDEFAARLLDSFDIYNFRDRKTMWNIDPYVNEHKLAYYKTKNILIIKCTVGDFFREYASWENSHYENRLKGTNNATFTNAKNSVVNLNAKLRFSLKGSIEQLNKDYRGYGISEEKFYRGEEPNYKVIENSFDIIRKAKLAEIRLHFENIFNGNHSLIPIVFLKGNFGTGKTTFNYRLIHELISTREDTIAFEITDTDNLVRESLKELIEQIKSKNVILFCNNVEIDSVYKSIVDLRSYLSSLQFSEINIYFILSIRENILEIHKKSRNSKVTFEYNIDSKLNRDEIAELLERLKRNGLIQYRDSLERAQIINKIEKKYASDSFITLLNLVTEGKHINNLRDAYFQLSPACQKAFIYTALVHRYNLFLPASALRSLVSSNWDEFREKVINVEGRGILIQEFTPVSKGADPDLYFRTKHPLIASELINEIHPREEKRFSLYKEIVQKITSGSKNGKFLVNLFKAIKNSREFKDSRVDQLFDESFKAFKEDPFFLLHYAINIQSRGGKNNLEDAIDKIKHAEELLDYRNDRFVHRKGVLYFRLSQLYYKEEKSELNFTLKYLNEAKDWLLLKQQLDPSSSFSYFDLLDLLIWELEKISFSEEETAKKKIFIEDLFDLAINAISDSLEMIDDLKKRYETNFQCEGNSKEYLFSLNEMYENLNLRPFACILLYNYFVGKGDSQKISELLTEIESYTYEDEVAKFLFKLYGRKLNDPNTRIKFYKLGRQMDWYEDENPLRYNYYYYVAESYSMQMHNASNYMNRINDRYQYLNPEFQRYWNEPDSENHRIFEGKVKLNKKGFKVFKSTELNRDFIFSKSILDKLNIGEECKVNLCFYLNGIRAILIMDQPV